MTSKQLVQATLTDLGQQIIRLQCQLKLLQLNKNDLIKDLFKLEDKETRLCRRIKSLKNKAQWELRTGAKLNPTQAHREPGEEWKDS